MGGSHKKVAGTRVIDMVQMEVDRCLVSPRPAADILADGGSHVMLVACVLGSHRCLGRGHHRCRGLAAAVDRGARWRCSWCRLLASRIRALVGAVASRLARLRCRGPQHCDLGRDHDRGHLSDFRAVELPDRRRRRLAAPAMIPAHIRWAVAALVAVLLLMALFGYLGYDRWSELP